MNSIHPNGSVASDCPYCEWVSEPRDSVGDAMQASSQHMQTCEARAASYAQVRSGVDPAARCSTCGGNNGAHGMVHTRWGNGGGGNHPCPRSERVA